MGHGCSWKIQPYIPTALPEEENSEKGLTASTLHDEVENVQKKVEKLASCPQYDTESGVELCGQLRRKQLRENIDMLSVHCSLSGTLLLEEDHKIYANALTALLGAAARVVRRDLHLTTELVALCRSLISLIFACAVHSASLPVTREACAKWGELVKRLRAHIQPDHALAQGFMYQLRVLDMGLAACPDLDTVKETIQGMSKLASGAWCMDAFAMLTGGVALATAAVNRFNKTTAQTSFVKVFTIQMLQARLLEQLADPETCCHPDVTAGVRETLREAQDVLAKEEKLWELACTFVELLLSLLLGKSRARSILHLDDGLRQFLFHGDGAFHGLASYLEVGRPPQLSKEDCQLSHGDGATGLFVWADSYLRMLKGDPTRTFQQWLQEGLEKVHGLAALELQRAAQRFEAAALDLDPGELDLPLSEDALARLLAAVSASRARALSTADACAETSETLEEPLRIAEAALRFLRSIAGDGERPQPRESAPYLAGQHALSKALNSALRAPSGASCSPGGGAPSEPDGRAAVSAVAKDRIKHLSDQQVASRDKLLECVKRFASDAVKTEGLTAGAGSWETLSRSPKLRPVYQAWQQYGRSERSLQRAAAAWRGVRLCACVLMQLAPGSAPGGSAPGEGEDGMKGDAGAAQELRAHLEAATRACTRVGALGDAGAPPSSSGVAASATSLLQRRDQLRRHLLSFAAALDAEVEPTFPTARMQRVLGEGGQSPGTSAVPGHVPTATSVGEGLRVVRAAQGCIEGMRNDAESLAIALQKAARAKIVRDEAIEIGCLSPMCMEQEVVDAIEQALDRADLVWEAAARSGRAAATPAMLAFKLSAKRLKTLLSLHDVRIVDDEPGVTDDSSHGTATLPAAKLLHPLAHQLKELVGDGACDGNEHGGQAFWTFPNEGSDSGTPLPLPVPATETIAELRKTGQALRQEVPLAASTTGATAAILRILRQKALQARAFHDWIEAIDGDLLRPTCVLLEAALSTSEEAELSDVDAAHEGSVPRGGLADALNGGHNAACVRHLCVELGGLVGGDGGGAPHFSIDVNVLEAVGRFVADPTARSADAGAGAEHGLKRQTAPENLAEALPELVKIATWIESCARGACRGPSSDSLRRALIQWTKSLHDSSAVEEMLSSQNNIDHPSPVELRPLALGRLRELLLIDTTAATAAAAAEVEDIKAKTGICLGGQFMMELLGVLEAVVGGIRQVRRSIMHAEIFMRADVAEPLSQLHSQLQSHRGLSEPKAPASLPLEGHALRCTLESALQRQARSVAEVADHLGHLELIVERLGLAATAVEKDGNPSTQALQEWHEQVAGHLCTRARSELNRIQGDLRQHLDRELSRRVEELGLRPAALPMRRALEAAQGLLDHLRSSWFAREDLWRVRERALSGCMLLERVLDRALFESEEAAARRTPAADDEMPLAPAPGGVADVARFLNGSVQVAIVWQRSAELDPRVLQTLTGAGEHVADMTRVLQNTWPSEGEKVAAKLEARVQALDEVHDRLGVETDAVVKKHLLVLARGEEAQLTQCLENVRSIPLQGIGILVHFHVRLEQKVATISNSLMEMRSELLSVQKDVTAIRQDVHLLVGASVDELLLKKRAEVLAAGLPHKPLVPPRSSGGEALLDLLHAFLQEEPLDGEGRAAEGPDDKNRVRALKKEANVEQLKEEGSHEEPKERQAGSRAGGYEESEEKQILCLIGKPGSGKSVLLQLFKHQLLELDQYVALFCPLAMVDDAHVDLVAQTLEHHYDFTNPRIGELKQRAQAGAVKLLICADGLDETPVHVREQNLFKSNLLEQWGPKGAGKKGGGSWPKLLITCRDTHFPANPEQQKRCFTTASTAAPKVLRIGDFGARIKDYWEAMFRWHIRTVLCAALDVEGDFDPIRAGQVTYVKPTAAGEDQTAGLRTSPYSEDIRALQQACLEGIDSSLCEAEYARALLHFSQEHPGVRLTEGLGALRQAGIWAPSQYIALIEKLPSEFKETVFMIEMLSKVLPRMYNPMRQERMNRLPPTSRSLHSVGGWGVVRLRMLMLRHDLGGVAPSAPSSYQIYQEFVLAHLEKEAERAQGGPRARGQPGGGSSLRVSRDQLYRKVIRWCEDLAVHMVEMDVTQVRCTDEVSATFALFNDPQHRLSQDAAPLSRGEEGCVSWLHLTIRDFFAAHQILSGLNQIKVFRHETLMELLLEKLEELFQEEQSRLESGDEAPLRDGPSTYPDLQSWVLSSDVSAPEMLQKHRRAFLKILRENPVEGLFKVHEAPNMLQELISQLHQLESIGLNRFVIQSLPEVEKFLTQEVVREPLHEASLVHIVKLSKFQPSLLRAAEGALHLLGSVHHARVQAARPEDMEVLHELGHFRQTYLHILASRPPMPSDAVTNTEGSHGPAEAKELLLERAGQLAKAVNEKNYWGQTPLDCVVSTQAGVRIRMKHLVDFSEFIAPLKKANADLDATYRGACLLHEAAQKGNTNLAAALLQNGCDVNSRNHKHETPLMTIGDVSPTGAQWESMRSLLVQNGGGEGRMPHKDVARLVREKTNHSAHTLEMLLKNGIASADRCPDAKSSTDTVTDTERMVDPLSIAIEVSNWEVVSMLLEYTERTHLDIRGCKTPNDFEKYVAGIKANGSIQSLCLKDYQIGKADAEKLWNALESSPTVIALDLLYALRDMEAVDFFTGAFAKSKTLLTLCGFTSATTNIDLSEQELSDLHAQLLAAELKKGVGSPSLTTLNVWKRGRFQVGGAQALATAVKQRNAPVKLCGNILDVQELSLRYENLEPADAVLLANDLVFNGSLTSLDMSENVIGAIGAKAMGAALTPNEHGMYNRSLNVLIVTAGVDLPVGVLRRNEVSELDLRSKDLRFEDAIILGAMLVSNESLNTLDLGGNFGPEGAKALAAALTPNEQGVFNKSLNTLSLAGNQLCGLRTNERHKLEGSYDASGIKALATALAFNGSLNTLNLDENIIGPEGAKALAVAFTPNEEGVFNTSLNTLNLYSNRIGDEGAKALADALTPNAEGVFNTSLNTLGLRNNDIGPEGAKALAVALTPNAEGVFNTSLNTLVLDCNRLCGVDRDGHGKYDASGITALAEALVFNTSLNTLNLKRNPLRVVHYSQSGVYVKIGADASGIKALADALALNKSLKVLSLELNDIGPEGARALAVALTPNEEGVFNTSLNTLALEYNNIGPEGAKALAVALTPNAEGVFNTSLNTLELADNQLCGLDYRGRGTYDASGIKALADALVFNTSLNTLDLSDNQIGAEGAKALAVALAPNAEGVFNGSLNTLNLADNQLCGLDKYGDGTYDASGIKALAEALVFNTSLNTLNLRDNDLGDEGEAVVQEAIRKHPNAAAFKLLI
ncbi:hypothetical protein CYMTET_30412 [Cymbomonas tetramitiformis]|uniref:Uncharacterized protein n=1 Tax=Cymbomonas tetramitiformis TaxID=36881 RepID=A0AAE0FJ55_9CHLO|nr:hypothetical protein CYMTET_30412 [Cymbomonas tetramitiformis]